MPCAGVENSSSQRPSGKTRPSAAAIHSERTIEDADTGFFYDSWTVRLLQGASPGFRRNVARRDGGREHTASEAHNRGTLLNPKEFLRAASYLDGSPIGLEIRAANVAWAILELHDVLGGTRMPALRSTRRGSPAVGGGSGCHRNAIQSDTGTIWEFYRPRLGDQNSLIRKPRGRSIPCQDYMGHNPLFAMVDLWQKCAHKP